ncbi:hyaluronoglucosaminidase [Ancylostoma caninum]|uniref:Hyaluronidase n=1 Tax=Ancylostoma caninum TaxID=29170 RepID=A0A368FK50_ANCCA|nr:hyaluronoglucosaminidase [Ancylostoma caninum]
MLFRALLVVLELPALLSAFKAYWNFPSATCQKNYSVEFEDFKIETNTNVSFYGEKVVIFYEFIFGRYPYYKGYNKSYPIYGGLPQNCSLEEHLKIAEQNITDKIKNKNFDGLAIIDLEEWRPLFDQNFWGLKSIFRNESIALAKTKHPNVTNDTELQKLAEEDFNKAAREFFVKTIQLGRKLRKNAKWGFYGFPYCNYNAGKNGTTECWKKYQDWNDKMMFIFNESDALYPSIYLGSNATSQERFLYVQAVLNEARRISKKFTPPKPIYAYTKIEYDPLKKINDFYDEKDLCSTIRQPADLGIDGIIIWSSSRNITLRCPYIQEKMTMNEGIGSKVKTIIEQHDQCRKTRCSDQGKCIRSTNSTCPGFTTMNTEEYYCECDQGYYDDQCSSQGTAPA